MEWVAALPPDRTDTLPLSGAMRARERFLAWAREQGLKVRPLQVRPLRPAEEGRAEVLAVSWVQEKGVHLRGRRVLTLRWPRRGVFERYGRDQVIMPVMAERTATLLSPRPEVEEMAVLVERRADPILAVRVGGQWYEVVRWLRRPYILTPEERGEVPPVHVWWPIKEVGASAR